MHLVFRDNGLVQISLRLKTEGVTNRRILNFTKTTFKRVRDAIIRGMYRRRARNKGR